MIRSMTGFGEASAVVEGIHYFVELRSLNNKYFKASLRLPEELQALEAEFEQALRHRLQRGSVMMTVQAGTQGPGGAQVISHAAIDEYVDQLSRARSIADGRVRLDLSALLNLPGVLSPADDQEHRLHAARAALTPLVDRAIDQLLDMRAREGESARLVLLELHDLIAARLAEITSRAPNIVGDYESRLGQRLRSLLDRADVRAEPADLIREVAVFAERTDIAEEISRLGEHLRHFRDLLTADGDRLVGRTLDFLTQEMLREANTISSKSPDAELTRLAVDIKAAVDRIKEQVQNIV